MTCHGKKSPEAKGAKLTDLTPSSSPMQPESFQMSFNEQICKTKKLSNAGDRLIITREMISCHRYKVKAITSLVLLRFSMKHFILLVRTLLLCPSNISHQTCVIAPWQEQFLIPHQSRLWRYGPLPNMTTPTLPMQPPCFMLKVINNTSGVQPPSSEFGGPDLFPIRTGPEHGVSSDTLTETDISYYYHFFSFMLVLLGRL